MHLMLKHFQPFECMNNEASHNYSMWTIYHGNYTSASCRESKMNGREGCPAPTSPPTHPPLLLPIWAILFTQFPFFLPGVTGLVNFSHTDLIITLQAHKNKLCLFVASISRHLFAVAASFSSYRIITWHQIPFCWQYFPLL